MTFEHYVKDCRINIDKQIRLSLPIAEPFYLYEPAQYACTNGGKKIRPIMLAIIADYYKVNKEHSLLAGTAIELFHIFSLVHDDIMDHDEFRRGKETVHKKWDEATAILAGDGLLAKATMIMSEIDHPRHNLIMKTFSETILRVCEGQAFDKQFENKTDIALDQYITMISLKTAWLLGCSARIGAILGTDDQKKQNDFFQFAFNIGIAFQIHDDILDLYADEAELGKDIGSDLYNNKNSVLSIFAKNYSLKKAIDFASKQEFIDYTKKYLMAKGVYKQANNLKDLYTDKAGIFLNSLTESPQKKYLKQLVEMLNSRNA